MGFFDRVIVFIHIEYGMDLNVLFFKKILHSDCYGNLDIVENVLSCLFA